MNYLSHHAVARAARPDGAPAFYVGNVLPDLVATSGEGRLREKYVTVPPAGIDEELLRGIRLHLAADQRFHGHPLFAAETERATAVLRSATFQTPLRRVFFLAHAFVEIAMDGWLTRQDASHTEDLYEQFDRGDLESVIQETGRLLGADGPLLGLARTIDGFIESRFLASYVTADGMARALRRVAVRASLNDLFANAADEQTLAGCFEVYLPSLAASMPELLTPPEPALWYNTRDFS